MTFSNLFQILSNLKICICVFRKNTDELHRKSFHKSGMLILWLWLVEQQTFPCNSCLWLLQLLLFSQTISNFGFLSFQLLNRVFPKWKGNSVNSANLGNQINPLLPVSSISVNLSWCFEFISKLILKYIQYKNTNVANFVYYGNTRTK